MKEQFVTYDIALKLKEIGFNEPVCGYFKGSVYSSDNTEGVFCWLDEWLTIENGSIVAAPLWQQVIDFLKTRKVLVAERWDGWEYGAYEWDDFIYTDTKEEAILKAIEICQVA